MSFWMVFTGRVSVADIHPSYMHVRIFIGHVLEYTSFQVLTHGLVSHLQEKGQPLSTATGMKLPAS